MNRKELKKLLLRFAHEMAIKGGGLHMSKNGLVLEIQSELIAMNEKANAAADMAREESIILEELAEISTRLASSIEKFWDLIEKK